MKKVIIIGGVAGGMSAATRLRRLDETAEITVIERTENISIANCGLPYYIGGVITDRHKLLVQTPASIKARFNIEVLVNTEVEEINRQQQTITAVNTKTGEKQELVYDNLVLATGASPLKPTAIKGIEKALTLRDLDDMDRIKAAAKDSKTAVVIGGGFVGLEILENLHKLGLKTILVEAQSQILPNFDREMITPLEQTITENGVKLILNQTVTEITDTEIKLSSGETIKTDLVVAALGVKPETSLAAAAGIKLGNRGGVTVNEYLQTSDPQIYAVGDAAEKPDYLTGDATLVALANTANLQGRLTADNIVGFSHKTRGVLGTAIIGLFGLQAAITGINEKRLQAMGRKYVAIHTHPLDHAGYYPGAKTLALKLLFDAETYQILGAQAVGTAGADKKIDVMATAITGGIKAYELAELELAYAPQFSSAKDPINMLGYIAWNIYDRKVSTLQWHELTPEYLADKLLLDVRTPQEYQAGHIPGAVNISVDELRNELTKIPTKPVIVYCAVGLRGYIASQILQSKGVQVQNLDGGYTTYTAGNA